MSADEITAVLLGGGAGLRVGGADKPLLRWRGRPLAAHVLAAMHGRVDALIVSANRNADRYRALAEASGIPLVGIVTDAPGTSGPLAGVAAALAACTTPWALVLPGDVPLVPAELPDALRAAVRPDVDAVIAHDGARRQHLHVLLRSALRDDVRGFVQRGGYRVWEWLDGLRALEVRVGTPERFQNFNTPEAFDA